MSEENWLPKGARMGARMGGEGDGVDGGVAGGRARGEAGGEAGGFTAQAGPGEGPAVAGAGEGGAVAGAGEGRNAAGPAGAVLDAATMPERIADGLTRRHTVTDRVLDFEGEEGYPTPS